MAIASSNVVLRPPPRLPRALVITGEADVLRDEGEACPAKLCMAGGSRHVVRTTGIIRVFVMANALRQTEAADGAINEIVDACPNPN